MDARVQSRKITAYMYSVDIAAARAVTLTASGYAGQRMAVAVSKLGNGPLYVFMPIVVFIYLGHKAPAVIITSTISALMLHLVYPMLKRYVARPRPFEADQSITSLLDVRDKYSFPSGHTMTAAASVVPIICADWKFFPIGAGIILTMSWARMATGHHYLSDVLAGIALGGFVGFLCAHI
ncbi:phosphatase PAP2 family protein [Methylovirgula sp. 4M-Z18]|uniref:phosphatase PAP2 family protein n=2 Tax=Methylovirgula sp. 4M-Z18 TaxID=2293567 RepID=UPI0030D21D90